MRSRAAARLSLVPLAMICASFFLPSCVAEPNGRAFSLAEISLGMIEGPSSVLDAFELVWPHVLALPLTIALAIALTRGGGGLRAARLMTLAGLLASGHDIARPGAESWNRPATTSIALAIAAVAAWAWSLPASGWSAWSRLTMSYALSAASTTVTTYLFLTALNDRELRLPGALVFILGVSAVFVLAAVGAPVSRSPESAWRA